MTREKTEAEKYDELMCHMQREKDRMEDEGEIEDQQDHLLSQAIDLALQQGRGWGPGEKEAYLEKILDDDFIPPLFATSQDEVEKSGLQEAFTSLIYDEPPSRLMLQFKKKGNDAFANGKRNKVGNMNFFRDAVNHYYEAFAWAQKVVPMQPGDYAQADTDEETYTEQELDELKSNLCANAALAHMSLKNWGFVRNDCKKALNFNNKNVKAWYRLGKAYQMLQDWEQAGDAIDSGLAVEGENENKDLLKLQQLLADRVQKARKLRQQRERKRAERVSRVKEVWKHCKDLGTKLGRISLVATVTDEEDEGDERDESKWNSHLPHTGELPNVIEGEWTWPCMFLYPSHHQSDFVKNFGESEMMAMRMALMFPELEGEHEESAMPWDFNNEFICSNLAVYFEIHPTATKDDVVHPDSVDLLKDQAETMRFYESSRALRGDEGPEMADLVKAIERKHLYQKRKAWKKKHGSLWALPEPTQVVRLHPAVTLRDVLLDSRLVVPNFLVTFYVFPESHPAHEAFLKEHKCVSLLQPKDTIDH